MIIKPPKTLIGVYAAWSWPTLVRCFALFLIEVMRQIATRSRVNRKRSHDQAEIRRQLCSFIRYYEYEVNDLPVLVTLIEFCETSTRTGDFIHHLINWLYNT